MLRALNRWLEALNRRLEARNLRKYHQLRCGDPTCTDDHPRRFQTRG